MTSQAEVPFAVQLGYAAQAMRRKAASLKHHLEITPHYKITGLESFKIKVAAQFLAYDEFDKVARAAIQTQVDYDNYVAIRDKE